jgi:cation-transporting ATPase I
VSELKNQTDRHAGSEPANDGPRRPWPHRWWGGPDRYHVLIPALDPISGLEADGRARLADELRVALGALPGVHWVDVDSPRRRLVIDVDPTVIGRPALEASLDAVEAAHLPPGLDVPRHPVGPLHPGDDDAILRDLSALAASAVGLSLGGFGRLLRYAPVPVELASVLGLIDNNPYLRRHLERRLGPGITDVTLSVGNAVAQGLTQGFMGNLTDLLYRAQLLSNTAAVSAAWTKAEADRWADGPRDRRSTAGESALGATADRPRPIPASGPDIYANRSALTAMTAAAAAAIGGRGRRAAALLIAGQPKAARMGPATFGSWCARQLVKRDAVVLDPRSLSRLGRVDTIVLDQRLLQTGLATAVAVRLLAEADASVVHEKVRVLFNEKEPTRSQRRGAWLLAPVPGDGAKTQPATGADAEAQAAAGELGPDRALMLTRAGRPQAVVAWAPRLSAVGIHLVRLARRHELLVVVAGADSALADQVGADLHLPGGPDYDRSIAMLQEDGCVVLVVAHSAGHGARALNAADVGVEVTEIGGGAWTGDVVVNEAAEAAFLLDAAAVARQIERQSMALSGMGSGLAALQALAVSPRLAAGRAATTVNAAAIAAMANGIRAARGLHRAGGHVPREPDRWHEMDPEEVAAALDSSASGLSGQEARRRQERSEREGAPPPSFARSTFNELLNPLTPILAAGAGASAAVGSVADAGIVAGVTVLNALIGGGQRYVAERAIQALGNSSSSTVTTRRDGLRSAVAADRLVPGDVITLQAGDAVPADCRVLSADAVELDESALTGESQPVPKGPWPVLSEPVAERSSMLYEGTAVAVGEVTAMVVAVGDNTEATRMSQTDGPVTSPGGVEARLHHLTRVTLPVSAAGGAAVLAGGLLRRQPFNQSVTSAVALSVASVPEGLPLLSTMAQLASARRLSSRNALVRNPRAVEALGRVQVLCTDKTGTLTEGRLRLRRVSDGCDDLALADLGAAHRRVLAGALRATPEPDADETRTLPHLTDEAVVQGARRAGVQVDEGCAGWGRVEELAFQPAQPYHATWGRTPTGSILSVKGAPETVLPRCRAWARAGGLAALDEPSLRSLQKEVTRLAAQSLRVLAVAERHFDPATPPPSPLDDTAVEELEFVGLVAFSDPVRSSSPKAVAELRRAGVEVIMVTGDHPSTARGIAVELGLMDGRGLLTGTDLARMSDPALERAVGQTAVFARVAPSEKSRIVAALQRNGRAVAMTGDGANDAPAIRLADVGIALGAGATPAARRAADVVITDERIETIVDAIVEGRAMWTSVRDALAILLGGNLGEVAFTVAATLVGGRAPLSARQLLAVNLFTDVAPALAIALRPPSERTPESLLSEGPDISLGRSLERAIVARATTTAVGAGLAYVGGRVTGRHQRASTMALAAVVGTQLAQTVLSGGFDPLVLAAGGGSALLLAIVIQTPGVSQFFGCTPLGPVAWSLALGSTALATALGSASGRVWPLAAELVRAGTDRSKDTFSAP